MVDVVISVQVKREEMVLPFPIGLYPPLRDVPAGRFCRPATVTLPHPLSLTDSQG